jgi:membrane protease YdiL (CAAX protease family)
MSIEPPTESLGIPADETPTRPCWRCGKFVDVLFSICPYCAANITRHRFAAQSEQGAVRNDRTLMHMLVAYAVLLVLSVVSALVIGLAFAGDRKANAGDRLTAILVLEGLDSLVILVALALIPMRASVPSKTIAEKAVAWIIFVPVLAMLLALNFLYHWIIRSIMHVDMVESRMFEDPALIRGWIFAACIQPAVIEELFFRYLALGALRSVTGLHSAVIISAVMFGMMHLGTPVSIPLLIVLGVGLGYARTCSGGMALPITLHFLHNAAVLGFEWMVALQ